jgi:predicted lipid-binding transport protein (Tim44 family)
MKKILTALSVALIVGSTTLVSFDAEAARLGSGRSSGMQRQMATPQPHQNTTPMQSPAQQQAARQQQPQPAAAPQAQPKRSWLGPLAGLAAGIGLAALASHFGFGEELASMMMIGLLVMGVLMVVGFLLRKKAPAGPQPAYAGNGMNYQPEPVEQQPLYRDAATAGASGAAGAVASTIPADFDTAGFTRQAKVNFIRLQAANDAGNLDDLREFTSPEMFGELKMDIVERGQKPQQTDVVSLDAEVLEVAEEANRYIVSVRFTGMLREDKDAAPAPFAEIWHMTKPRDGSHGWVLAGIQQSN